LYNASLVGFAGSATGAFATAKISVDGSGSISDIVIMDGGSSYGIGNTLSVVGVATTTGYSPAVVTVTQIYNNVGDTIRISGVSSEGYSTFNDLYRITNVTVGAGYRFAVSSASSISVGSTLGIGTQFTLNAFADLTGEAIRVSSLAYDNNSGIATITTSNRHGLKVDNKIRLIGSTEEIYNGDFVVKENLNLNSFSVTIGVGTFSPSAAGTLYAYREGVTSNGGTITVDNENLNGRMIPTYAGITTTLSALIPDALTDQINIQNIENLDIKIGDYLVIDEEIVRVKTTIPSTPTNPIYVFRGVLGTKAVSHSVNSVVRRIYANPIEFRRHSIIRASGHTFEYVGFGPGNYSTAFPDKQDRQISSIEELLAQSTRKDGGINFYTGMNDKGISYSGNKRLSSVTGQEEIFDTPVQTVTGEDIGGLPGLNVITPVQGTFSRSIRVDGGSDGKSISEFNGPVVFGNKITSTSNKGIEAFSLFLQGDATVSRKYTVGVTTPILSGNPGDVIYYQNPTKGGYLGWVYTTDNEWYRFGAVSLSKDLNIALFDQVGIATTSPGSNLLQVGGGSSIVSINSSGGVGIGTSANQFKLQVNGSTNFIGTCYGSYFSGDGSGLTNINVSAAGWSQISGGIYNTLLSTVGIGTSVPRFNLEVGPVGTSATTLYVNGEAVFAGIITANNVFVSGMLTATAFDLKSTSGQIRAGIVTTTNLIVGSAGTTLTTNGPLIGIGTAVPRAKLDIEGHTRFKTYSEVVQTISSSSNIVTIDLSQAQSFDFTLSETVNQFTIINAPSGASSFVIKIAQNAIGGYLADIDDFRNSSGGILPVYWPGGGVLPTITPTANRADIYSFKTFDGGVSWYGFVDGQNFVN
jgi:hypothetical protein